ncbi:hypothetical protein ACTFIR_004741 [Dictyostelium discoideum]
MFNAFKKIWAPTVNNDEDESKERLELGISEELIQLVDNISRFPESFKDFPFQTLKDPSLKMTKIQKRHVEKILEIVKPLNDLRFQMCPSVMNDEKFWKIYFTHIQVVSKGMFNQSPSSTTTTTTTGTTTQPQSPTNFLEELDSQFDKLSSKKKPFDEGISEEEDSYFSINTYMLQSKQQQLLQQQQQQQQQQLLQQQQQQTQPNSLKSSTSSITPNKSPISGGGGIQIGNKIVVTQPVTASSPTSTLTPTLRNNTDNNRNDNNNNENNNSNAISPQSKPNNNNNIEILNNTNNSNNTLIDTNFDNINNTNIITDVQRNIELDKSIDNFLNPS